MNFKVANIEFLDFADGFFDAIISVDTIFFGRKMEPTIAGLNRILKANGPIAVFNGDYQQGNFLASLTTNKSTYEIYDFSQEQVKHMLLKHKAAKELQKAFEAKGNTFVWKDLMVESFA